MVTFSRRQWIPVIVGALGYFVDIYDLVLFSIVRIESLRSLGILESDLMNVGVTLLNSQMFGMLIGGILWGILGDKRGRLSVLFGSILLYSTANIANAYVETVSAYAFWRFVAGFGLAGELGAAITLVSETLPKETRGYGTAIVAGIGVTGAIAAGLTADFLPWRSAYLVGGAMGLALLILRIGVLESGMFLSQKLQKARRGDLLMLLNKPKRFIRFVACVGIGIPIWFVVGILMTFAPEFSQALHIQGPVTAGYAILFCYAGLSVGDFASGFLSQIFGTRRRVVLSALLMLLALVFTLLLSRGLSNQAFYALCFALGLSTGYWAIFVTVAAEHFGTNLRATVATSVPNLVRGSVVILTSSFRGLVEPLGILGSAMLVGTVSILLALISLAYLEETFGRDLDYLEV